MRNVRSESLHKELEKHGLHQKVQVNVEIVDRLEPAGNEKFRRIVCKVEKPTDEIPAQEFEQPGDYAA